MSPIKTIAQKVLKHFRKLHNTKKFDKQKIAQFTEKCHYNSQLEIRVKCDASRSKPKGALEKVLERRSVNEIEQFRIVWSIDYIKNY